MEFGDYVQIEEKRFGVKNEFFTYKVVGTLRSNKWVDVPVYSPRTERLHSEMEEVIACIVVGIEEREVLYYRVKDVREVKYE
jgi:hypothetical protein